MHSAERFAEALKAFPELSDTEDVYARCATEKKKIKLYRTLKSRTRSSVRENMENHIYENSFSGCRSTVDEPERVILRYRISNK